MSDAAQIAVSALSTIGAIAVAWISLRVKRGEAEQTNEEVVAELKAKLAKARQELESRGD